MNKKLNSYNSPSKDAQLTLTEQTSGSVVSIPVKAYNAVLNKSENNSKIRKVLEQVYARGVLAAEESSNQSPQQQAFSRMNSFLNYGKAYDLDMDLLEDFFDDPYSAKSGGTLTEYQLEQASLRAKQKGRSKPNLLDVMWAEQQMENNKYKTTSIVKSVLREAYKGKRCRTKR